MKKLKLSLLTLLFPVICIGQSFTDYEDYQKQNIAVKLSLDPKSNTFCIYFNNILNVQSYKMYDNNLNHIFTHDDHLDVTQDNIYFSLHKTYYKLYYPPDSMLFVVRMPSNIHDPLGNHLIWLLNILRMHQKQLVLGHE